MGVPDVTVPAYTDDEQATLSQQLRRIVESVHSGALSLRRLDASLLCHLHRELFQGVRGHAGRMRGVGFGSETLRFGTRYAVHRREVERLMEALFHRLDRDVRALQGNQGEATYEERVLRVALRAHAEVIRIHPFEDGNGRSSRLLLDVVLVRLHLRPISFDIVRADYITALEAAFEGEPGLLVDLAIRLSTDRM